jgi:aryl-alcohol dehydrogenase-like predicted oxidoreductase
MKEKQNSIDRRNFLKTMGAAGIGSVLASTGAVGGPNESGAAGKTQKSDSKQMPKRKLGKTGVKVSCLGLGTMFNLVDNQIVLINTLKNGVTFWDTAHSYAGGNSELGIGKFLAKNPKVRKNLFIVSKASRARTVKDVEARLQTSLKRMNTDYIDLYYAPHGASDPAQFTDELKQWAESAKKRKLIRFFGFSTHSNMAKCLVAASKLGWIDVIMPRFNFRIMQDPEMQAAIDACHKAKIGIVAMKTTGKTTISRFRKEIETEAEKKMVAHFLERGFTPEQAAIKLALADERITAAPVQMENTRIIAQNVAAVLDKTELTQADGDVFKEYAAATCSGYCAGCAEICDAALPDLHYTSDIMRYLMYYNSYGDQDRARELFAQIPADVRSRLLNTDYSIAEARCPQNMPIGELVAEAVRKLA